MIVLRAETPSIFVSPQIADRAYRDDITGLTVNKPDLDSIVHAAAGTVKPLVGALVIQGWGERRRNPSLLHIPQTGTLDGAPLVDLEDMNEAARIDKVNWLRLRPHTLTLEGLRRATYMAANKWHEAPGAWDNILWVGTAGGGGLGFALDILYNSTHSGDFGNLRNNTIATAAGALLGAAGFTPVARNVKYRYDARRRPGRYPIQPRYSGVV